MQLPAFVALEQRLNSAVTQRLSNAMLQLSATGPAWACIYEATRPEGSPFADVATTLQHSVSAWLSQGLSVCEGDQVILTTSQWPSGKACRITTAVDIDATGWATFDVIPLP